jgi:hypothetical protein
MRIFNYKGYEIKEFPYGYGKNTDRWEAHNTEDCDEVMIVSDTFESVLDEIDYRIDCKF